MDDVQLAARGFGDAEERGGGRVPDQTVVRGQGLAVCPRGAIAGRPVALLDHVHDGLVVGMHHQALAGGRHRLHGPVEIAVVVHADGGRVRIGATGVDHHVDLVGGDVSLRHGADLIDDLGGRVVVVVDEALGGVHLEHVVEVARRHCGGIEIRHSEDRRVAAGRGGARARDQVFLVGVAGLSRVDVDVDAAGYGHQSGGVDAFGVGRRQTSAHQTRDRLALDDDVEGADRTFHKDVGIGNDPSHGPPSASGVKHRPNVSETRSSPLARIEMERGASVTSRTMGTHPEIRDTSTSTSQHS